MKLLARIRSWCIDTTNRIAHLVRDNRGVSAAVLSGIVLVIMIYGTFVSVLLPKQRMERLIDAYTAGDFQESIEIAQKIVDADPRNVKAALALASSLLQQGIIDGNIDSVIDRVRGILRGIEPFATAARDLSEINRQLGYTYMLTGELDRAFEYLSKAITLDPENAMAYAQLCSYYDLTNDMAKLKENCQQALRLDPQNALAMLGLVKGFLSEKDLRQARLYAESAISSAPDRIVRAKALVAAANVEIATLDLDTAREDVKRALVENPKEFDALVLSSELTMRSLATVAISGGDPMEDEEWIPMLQHAAQAMRINSSNYYPYLLFMRAYEIAGNVEGAARHRSIATRLVKNDMTLTAAEKKQILERLNAANNIALTDIKLVPSGTAIPDDAVHVFIKQ